MGRSNMWLFLVLCCGGSGVLVGVGWVGISRGDMEGILKSGSFDLNRWFVEGTSGRP